LSDTDPSGEPWQYDISARWILTPARKRRTSTLRSCSAVVRERPSERLLRTRYGTLVPMASGTTRRIEDGTLVPWNEAVAAWATAGRPVLEQVARTFGAYRTYQQLADDVQTTSGITTGVPFRHWIGQVLFAIASEQRSRPGEPFLTALVVHADGTIGDGYATPLLQRDGFVPDDLEMQAAEERLRCYRYFGAELPPDGGRPTLTREVAARRSTSGRRRQQQPRAVCPTCFVQLPLTGVCDSCGTDVART
jgi:hypothetical protein